MRAALRAKVELCGMGSGSVKMYWHESIKTSCFLFENELKRNAVSGAMVSDLVDNVCALKEQLEGSNPMKPEILAIRGANEAFCAGADIKVFGSQGDNAYERGMMMSDAMTWALDEIAGLSIPTVIFIEGAAVGGGAELATAGDLRVFDPNASIQFVHRKMGVVPGWGGARRLRNIVGEQRAKSMLLTAQRYNSKSAGALCDVEMELVGKSTEDLVAELFGGDSPTLRTLKQVAVGSLPEREAFNELWLGPAHRRALEPYER